MSCSVISGWLYVQSPGIHSYAIAILFTSILLIIQFLGIMAAIVVPAFVLLSRGRFNLSRLAICLFILASFGVVAEVIALCMTPADTLT